MASAVTSDQVILEYQRNYRAFFGCEPPPVRKLESGSFSVRFQNGSKRYSKSSLAAVSAMMRELKDEVF